MFDVPYPLLTVKYTTGMPQLRITTILSVPLNHAQRHITLELDVIDKAVIAFLYSLFHLQITFGEGGKRSLLDLLYEVEKSSVLKTSPSVRPSVFL